ncbi:hypothetical protein MGA5115_02715 [Marinomonas gallaica]|uniref:Phosphate ABC transporter substrate-binding protein n=1 Tax=Marinomonas gallaica TaxID=1806667 RepID=A0A1C3JTK9_9GAMM|nr:hypothetical protein [Marinomonas gallaica]SBT18568.1 hypothetical protein MGA5115_02715 [Marinomonas gallaica]SBT21523.1 hypothetical protein MGA5116_02119 [Marinomonas gallaica]
MITTVLTNTTTAIFLLAVTLLIAPLAVADDNRVKVIANSNTNLSSLSSSEVRQIYMGGTLSRRFQAVTLPVEHPLRKTFNVSVIGLTENRIQSYWAQLLFTGRSTPPRELSSIADAINFVIKEPAAIAYVSSDTLLPEGVIVVFER